jgi:hypothetical protein
MDFSKETPHSALIVNVFTCDMIAVVALKHVMIFLNRLCGTVI